MRRGTIRRPKKVVRRTASETYLVNSKYLGKECYQDDGTEVTLGKAITWHHYMCDNGDARDAARDFLAKRGKTSSSKKVSTIPDASLPLTSCWIGKLYLEGWNIKPESLAKSERLILEAIPKSEPKAEKTDTEKKSVYALMLEKVSEVIGDIEAAIDLNDPSFSMYDYLTSNSVPQKYVPSIISYYVPLLQELNSIKTDKDLKEAYKNFTPSMMKDKIKLVSTIISDLERWNDNQKKTRAPRKKRVVSADKKTSKLTYQTEDQNLKLQSVRPASLIGANEVYLYNTKYGILSYIVAKDRGGIDLKGQTLQNFDDDKSSEKRIGRIAESFLSEILSSTKTQAKKKFEALKPKPSKVTGRINSNTILLRTL